MPMADAPAAQDQALADALRLQHVAAPAAPPPVAPVTQDTAPAQAVAALAVVSQGGSTPEAGAAPATIARHAPREAEAAMHQIVAPITTLAAAGGGDVAGAPRSVTIALHPVELGRVELKVERRADGRLAIGVAVERAETLALLRTDQGTLDRALTQAGLPPENRSISFDLAGNGAWGNGAQQQAGMDSRGGREGRVPNGSPADPAQAGTDSSRAGTAAAATRQAGAAGRLDISI
jgi:flagellar hook-length control protein FliK